MMQQQQDIKNVLLERIIAVGSYITFGTVGFIWLLVALFTKNTLKPYLKYHVFQSIFISIFYFLVCAFLGMIMDIFSMVPVLNIIIMQITFYLNAPLIFGLSIIQTLIDILILYLVITSFQGKYSYLPWISEIIKVNVKN